VADGRVELLECPTHRRWFFGVQEAFGQPGSRSLVCRLHGAHMLTLFPRQHAACCCRVVNAPMRTPRHGAGQACCTRRIGSRRLVLDDAGFCFVRPLHCYADGHATPVRCTNGNDCQLSNRPAAPAASSRRLRSSKAPRGLASLARLRWLAGLDQQSRVLKPWNVRRG